MPGSSLVKFWILGSIFTRRKMFATVSPIGNFVSPIGSERLALTTQKCFPIKQPLKYHKRFQSHSCPKISPELINSRNCLIVDLQSAVRFSLSDGFRKLLTCGSSKDCSPQSLTLMALPNMDQSKQSHPLSLNLSGSWNIHSHLKCDA